jgi:hypothetical protein
MLIKWNWIRDWLKKCSFRDNVQLQNKSVCALRLEFVPFIRRPSVTAELRVMWRVPSMHVLCPCSSNLNKGHSTGISFRSKSVMSFPHSSPARKPLCALAVIKQFTACPRRLIALVLWASRNAQVPDTSLHPNPSWSNPAVSHVQW